MTEQKCTSHEQFSVSLSWSTSSALAFVCLSLSCACGTYSKARDAGVQSITALDGPQPDSNGHALKRETINASETIMLLSPQIEMPKPDRSRIKLLREIRSGQ